jgi:hypothetical protein
MKTITGHLNYVEDFLKENFITIFDEVAVYAKELKRL